METDKNIFQNIVKHKPAIKLWSSVRVKFVVIIVVLLLVVISTVAVSVAIAIIRPYKDLLSDSLLLQTKILLDNLEQRMQNHIQAPNEDDIDLLLLNRVAFPEAQYVVITGKSAVTTQEGIQYVLATDYQDINKVISTYRYIPGVSQFCPDGIDEILQKMVYINSEATTIVQQHTASLQSLKHEIALLGNEREPYSLKRKTELQARDLFIL